MKSSEIADIIQELEQKFGRFEKGKVTIAAGEDLLIRPTTSKQQGNLLDTNRLLKDAIEVTTSLPNSVTKKRIIIRHVPTCDTSEDILQALNRKGYQVTNDDRFNTNKGTQQLPSTTVALEFEGPPLQQILLNGLVFRTEAQRSSPLRCKKCQRIGHTKNHCDKEQVCTNCGKAHESTDNCTTAPRCVNCNGGHPSSSPSCPKFTQIRTISRANEGNEKQVTYSETARKNLSAAAVNPKTEILKDQEQAIQTEMQRFRTEVGNI